MSTRHSPPGAGPASDRLARVVRWLDIGIEFGVYLYVFALFNRGTTALSNIGAYLPLLLWMIKHALTRGAGLAYLRTALGAAVLAFACWTGASALWAPDPLASLLEWRKTLGWMLASALVMGDLFRDERRLQRLIRVIGWSGAWIVGLDIAQYFREYGALGELTRDIKAHRAFADAFVFFAPFALCLAALSRGWKSLAWLAVFAVQVGLLVPTGSRGAWAGLAAGLLVWLAPGVGRSFKLAIGAAVLIAVAMATVVFPRELSVDRAARGVSSPSRFEGIWKPTYAMIAERPLAGFGYGREVYHGEFNERVRERPDALIRSSVGPHSNYLEIAFAAGLPGLLALLALYAAILHAGVAALRAAQRSPPAVMALAAMGSFVGLYVVRGFLESIRWQPLGVLLGLILALVLLRRQPGGTGSAGGT